MIKRMIILLFMSSLILLNSCIWRLPMFIADDQKADARLEQLIKAIDNKDKDAVKDIFSEQALNETEDIDERIEYLFGLMPDKVDSWESSGGLIIETMANHGHIVEEVKSFYRVDSAGQEYMFFLLDYTIDNKNPGNVGLYTLRVIRAEDEETHYTYWQDMVMAGIYKPEDSE